MTDPCADYSVSARNASSRGGIYIKGYIHLVLLLNFLKIYLKITQNLPYLFVSAKGTEKYDFVIQYVLCMCMKCLGGLDIYLMYKVCMILLGLSNKKQFTLYFSSGTFSLHN